MYLSLKQGSETTRMFVSQGDDIQLSLNTAEFDESIKYTGSELALALRGATFWRGKYMAQILRFKRRRN